MANRSKLVYIAGFVGICWIGSAGLIGIFLGIAHFLKSSAAVITLFLVMFYSCLFGLLGWQVYTWKGRRDGWPSATPRRRGRARVLGTRKKDSDNAEDAESGWK